MSLEGSYKICEEQILVSYHAIKENIDDTEIVCQHLGTFSQNVLISIVSLLERALVHKCEDKAIMKRLNYIIIECIQNIIYHSDKLPDNHQLAFIIVTSNDDGYKVYLSNSLKVEYVDELVSYLDNLLSKEKEAYTDMFFKKIMGKTLKGEDRGGLGLLTLVDKMGKEFKYSIKKVSDKYAFFNIEMNLKYKNFRR